MRSFASVTLLEGNTVTISCIPNVTDVVLYWVYNDNGTMIAESTGRIGLFPLGFNYELTITNPVMADSGIYYCRSNIEDLIVEQNITVSVVAGRYCICCQVVYTYEKFACNFVFCMDKIFTIVVGNILNKYVATNL